MLLSVTPHFQLDIDDTAFYSFVLALRHQWVRSTGGLSLNACLRLLERTWRTERSWWGRNGCPAGASAKITYEASPPPLPEAFDPSLARLDAELFNLDPAPCLEAVASCS